MLMPMTVPTVIPMTRPVVIPTMTHGMAPRANSSMSQRVTTMVRPMLSHMMIQISDDNVDADDESYDNAEYGDAYGDA